MELKEIRIAREVILKASARSGEGHIPSALSILDIIWVMYDKILNIESIKSGRPDRDRFILSKGHGALALYAVLSAKNFFQKSELVDFAEYTNMLGGHPDRNKVPGVEASTGSLGHGFPMSVGVALGYKIQNFRNRTYVLIGDGECNEGTVWEAALLASHHKLSNLCCIVDSNHSSDRALDMGDIASKFKAFGWDSEIISGHNHTAIAEALLKKHSNKPRAVIAETIKGHGCKCMENNPAWHRRAPTAQELQEMLKSLS